MERSMLCVILYTNTNSMYLLLYTHLYSKKYQPEYEILYKYLQNLQN
jgi:hypothetical protein